MVIYLLTMVFSIMFSARLQPLFLYQLVF